MKLSTVEPQHVQRAAGFIKKVVALPTAFDDALAHDTLLLRHCREARLTSPQPQVTLVAHAGLYDSVRQYCLDQRLVLQPTNDEIMRTLHLERLAMASHVPVLQRFEHDQPIMFEALVRWACNVDPPLVALTALAQMYRIVELLPDPAAQPL